MSPTASAQLYTSTTSTGNWLNTTGTAGRWSSSSSGPFSSNFVASSNTIFATAGTYTFDRLVTTGSATLGNITTAANVNIGFTTSSGQTLNFGGAGGAVRTIDLGAGSTVDFGSIAMVVGNGITKNGAGTLALTGGGYTGGFTLNAGNVIARGANALGTGALTINGGAIGSGAASFVAPARTGGPINIGGNFQIGIADGLAVNSANMTFGASGNGFDLTGSARTITLGSSGSMTFAQAITNGSLTLNRLAGASAGQFGLSGANTISALTLDNVTVNASGQNTALGAGTVTLTGADATTLNIRSALTLANNFTIANSDGIKTIANSGANATINGTITNNDSTVGDFVIGATTGRTLTIGSIAGTGGVTFGGGTLVGTVLMNGASTYAGNTVIDGSILKMGENGSVAPTNLVFQQTGGSAVTPVFDLNGTVQTVTGLDDSAFAGIIRSTLSGAKLIVGDSNNSTFAGTIISGNSLELEKVGSGKLTLTGTNTYTGATTVAAGLLTVNGSISSSALTTVQSGAAIGGSGTVGALVVETGATIAPGNSPGTLTVSGDAVWEAGGNYNWQLVDADGGAGADWDTIHITGELDLSNLTLADPFKVNLWSLSTFAGSGGDALNFDGSLNYSWTIASASGGITGFDADNFSIYTAAMNGTNGFSNDFTGGTFSVGVTGNDLNLMYQGPSAVPEPASAFTVLALFSSGVLHRRRRVVRGGK